MRRSSSTRVRPVLDRDEAPLAREVAEVTAEVLAAEPLRRVVHLAQRVADALDLRVDLVLDDRAAALLVALEHVDGAHRALPLRDANRSPSARRSSAAGWWRCRSCGSHRRWPWGEGARLRRGRTGAGSGRRLEPLLAAVRLNGGH